VLTSMKEQTTEETGQTEMSSVPIKVVEGKKVGSESRASPIEGKIAGLVYELHQQPFKARTKLTTAGVEKPTPLVMLHGWGHSRYSLRSLAELIAVDRDVYVIDLPGFGESPLDVFASDSVENIEAGTEEYADVLIEFFKQVGLHKILLFGTSFGGRISLRVAKKAPNILMGLILLNSHGLRRTPTKLQKIRYFFISCLRKLVKFIDTVFSTSYFNGWFVPRFASVDYKNAGKLKNILVKTVTEDQSYSLKEITTPTMLVWGEADTEAPLEFYHRFKKEITGASHPLAEHVSFPQAGHLFYLEGGSYLAASVIKPWLNKVDKVEKNS